MAFAKNMNTILNITLIFITSFCVAQAGGKQEHKVVKHQRPNSGEMIKQDWSILANDPTSKLLKWVNPYMGFAVHVHKDETISIYRKSFISEVDKSLTVKEVVERAKKLPLYGNPGGILITSDLTLGKSKVGRSLVNQLTIPSIQLFYVSTPKVK